MKQAIITGGSSGLGLEMAKCLAATGYHPLIIARQKDKIETAVTAIREKGQAATGFQADITNHARLSDVARSIGERFGKIDFLILNAGVVHVKLLEDYGNMDEMKEDVEVNLWGTILSARVFLPLLDAGSKILIISSGFGLMGAAGYSTYCAAKAGLINFGEALGRELQHKAISVYVACPGDIDTPQYRQERENMPQWMKPPNPARSSVMSPKVAAEKIIGKCNGKKLIITTDPGVSALILCKRFLPGSLVNFVINKIFPMPGESDSPRG